MTQSYSYWKNDNSKKMASQAPPHQTRPEGLSFPFLFSLFLCFLFLFLFLILCTPFSLPLDTPFKQQVILLRCTGFIFYCPFSFDSLQFSSFFSAITCLAAYSYSKSGYHYLFRYLLGVCWPCCSYFAHFCLCMIGFLFFPVCFDS